MILFQPINPGIDKGTAKVVHAKDIEELGEVNAFCRCWKSKEVSTDRSAVLVLMKV